MKYKLGLFFIGFGLILFGCSKMEKEKVIKETSFTKYVDPFIGTGGHGHTYPGASLPFGMLQVSPDNGTSDWDWCSGYHYSDSITIGFSHLHLSGTGIGDLYDIRLMPINKKVDLSKPVSSRNDLPYKSSYTHDQESATPGYYKVFLKDFNISAELTTDVRTGFHKYTYEKNDLQSVILDLGFAINWDKSIETYIKVVDKNSIIGYRYSQGWAKNQKVFFVIKFSKTIENYDLIVDGNYTQKKKEIIGERSSVQLFFNKDVSQELSVKVGLSSVSIENAELNIKDHEGTFKFDEIRSKAKSAWNNNLKNIQVETSNDSLKNIFYTALYHTQLAPVTFSDKNNQFRFENDSIGTLTNSNVYSTLSLWDTFRAEHPLLTLIQPSLVSDVINSMLAYYDQSGILPVWTLYGNETNTMTGYHAIPVIVEAYTKGIKGFDVEKAYEAMKATMMQNERGLEFYKEYGYIPYDLLDESVTITLEYAYDDWCVAQLAKALGKSEDYEYFLNRSEAYSSLFDKNTGFMRGKSKDGLSWHEPFDPKYSAHRVHADYTEGNAWQHSWFVLHNVENLIALHGGDANFCDKLEQLFGESSEITGDNVSADISGLIGQYAHGNEPSHHIAYMFNYANQPWRTQFWVREILKTQYALGPEGLSGNEDCGQMSAWFVLSSMGIYPLNPASGEYQIGSPMFKRSSIKVSQDNSFDIIANNASEENIYIQSAILNGKNFNRTTLTHKEIVQGGILEFTMGSQPNKSWGIDHTKSKE